jgi:hypothetical protein
MLRSTLTAERHIVETELLVARQKEALDQLVRDGRSRPELDLARSALATLESKLRFAKDHLSFERYRYGTLVDG